MTDEILEQLTKSMNVGDNMSKLAATGDPRYERRDIEITKIAFNPNNREIHQDVVERLANSIQEEGLGQFPLVRLYEDGGEHQYQMVAGHHRVLAFNLLYERTGDKRWASIPCIIDKELDDDTATRLLWATNLHSASLSAEEQGMAYEALGLIVDKMRESDPESLRGVSTDDAVAALASRDGNPVSSRTVRRKKAAAKVAREREAADEVVVEKTFEEDNAERADDWLKKLELAVRHLRELKDDKVPIDEARLKKQRNIINSIIGKKKSE